MRNTILLKYCLAVTPLAVCLQLFVGIPLHEAAHFLVAKLAGGAPVFSDWHRVSVTEPLPLWSYVAVAAAGPVMSLGAGAAFFLVGKMAWQKVSMCAAKHQVVKELCCFLAILLAVFGATMFCCGLWNLLPLPNSDGSKIYRAITVGEG